MSPSNPTAIRHSLRTALTVLLLATLLPTSAATAGEAPADTAPDAYLFVVGGRVPSEEEPNFNPELDAVDTSVPERQAKVDVRSVLVADVDTRARTVTNWRRAGILPTEHPESGKPVQWSYIENSVHYHDGRLYVGPGHCNLDPGYSGPVSADFIAWADVDLETGELGEFSTSAPFPSPPSNQRLCPTVITEVNGAHYLYVLGGNREGSGQTGRILYASIDPGTGTLGKWNVTTTPLPEPDWFNAAVAIRGKIIHTAGWSRQKRYYDWVAPEPGGDITDSWTTDVYSWEDGRYADHGMVVAKSGEREFLYLVGGHDSLRGPFVATDQVHFVPLEDGLPDIPAFREWPTSNPMPAPRRRAGIAAYRDMIVVPGGSTDQSYLRTQETLFIGHVAPDGEVTWTESEEPLLQARSFHGTAFAPIP